MHVGVNNSTGGIIALQYQQSVRPKRTASQMRYLNIIYYSNIFGRLPGLSFYLGELALCLGGRLKHKVNQIHQYHSIIII